MSIDNYEVVKKLIGSIEPVGEHHTDSARLENLEKMTDLVDKLLRDISDVARYNKDRHEASMNAAGTVAHNFLYANGITDY